MKRLFLLSVMSSLIVMSAFAQSMNSDLVAGQQSQSLTKVIPDFIEQEMQMRAPGEAVPSPRKSPTDVKPYYLRPAGAFYSKYITKNGAGFYSVGGYEFIQLKPYSDYTYYSVVNGADENDEIIWDWYSEEAQPRDFTVNYDLGMCETPYLYLYHSDVGRYESFQYPYHSTTDGTVIGGNNPAIVFSYPQASMGLWDYSDDECELLLSSKTMCEHGRNGNLSGGVFLSYHGAVPFDKNSYGWWFGKNGGHFDGMAQAFEKPTHPYLLKNVCMQTGHLSCEAPVQLCCSVYRLDEIPAYRDDEAVELSAQLGELVARGYSLVTPETNDECNGLITFTLYAREDGLDYEITPTIDYPILLVIEDYNNPEYNALRDFTCYISADIHVDEGYGELAYLKCPVKDDEGNFTGEYRWRGLNNFFTSGELKTGYSIFIVADYPYMAFRHQEDKENPKFVFSPMGGEMQRKIDGKTVYGIQFHSSVPVEDGWELTCNGDELPDWLQIELIDDEDEEFDDIVTARVIASPMSYSSHRKAVVRFSFPGAYQDYTFIQEDMIGPDPDDPTIVDVIIINNVILGKLPLTDEIRCRYDINKDGEINIADANELLKIILEN